jgi:hypothetical protein
MARLITWRYDNVQQDEDLSLRCSHPWHRFRGFGQQRKHKRSKRKRSPGRARSARASAAVVVEYSGPGSCKFHPGGQCLWLRRIADPARRQEKPPPLGRLSARSRARRAAFPSKRTDPRLSRPLRERGTTDPSPLSAGKCRGGVGGRLRRPRVLPAMVGLLLDSCGYASGGPLRACRARSARLPSSEPHGM